MKEKIAMLLPSRMRSRKIEECTRCFLETQTGFADLIVLLDEDDPQLSEYIRHEGIFYDVAPRLKMCPTVNRAAQKYIKTYQYIGFLGDDHFIRTKGWDKKMIEKIKELGGCGIVYGNDLLQGEALATHAVMSSNIPETLGYMAIPGLIHLYMDNFWMHLGRGVERLVYMPDIVIEHMHYGVGKSAADEQYLEVNSGPVYEHDLKIFNTWKEGQAQQDIHKLKQIFV